GPVMSPDAPPPPRPATPAARLPCGAAAAGRTGRPTTAASWCRFPLLYPAHRHVPLRVRGEVLLDGARKHFRRSGPVPAPARPTQADAAPGRCRAAPGPYGTPSLRETRGPGFWNVASSGGGSAPSVRTRRIAAAVPAA